MQLGGVAPRKAGATWLCPLCPTGLCEEGIQPPPSAPRGPVSLPPPDPDPSPNPTLTPPSPGALGEEQGLLQSVHVRASEVPAHTESRVVWKRGRLWGAGKRKAGGDGAGPRWAGRGARAVGFRQQPQGPGREAEEQRWLEERRA